MSYYNVHFRIEAGYKWGEGMNESASSDFHNEINQLFIDAGWGIKQPRFTAACPDAVKGKSNLYLHPMDVSGAIDESLIDEVKEILGKGKTFTHYDTDIYEELKDWTDDEYTAWLDERKNNIRNDLLKAFSTKRSNLYITNTGAVVRSVKEKYHVPRLETHTGRSSSDVEWGYVGKVLEEMVDAGYFMTAETKNGTGYRTRKENEKTA